MLAVAPAFALQLPLFERLQFMSRVVGWRGVADAVRAKLVEQHYGAIVVDTRELAAELLYYLRDEPVPLYVLLVGPNNPSDHYEMTRPFTAATPEPILFISLTSCPERITKLFADVRRLAVVPVPLIETKVRMLHFCRLAGYKGS
jgi:hypothetical protein